MVSIRRIVSRVFKSVKSRISKPKPKPKVTVRTVAAKRLPSRITRDVQPKSSFKFTGFSTAGSRDLGGGGGGSSSRGSIQPVTNFIQAPELEPIKAATRRLERSPARTIARQFGTFRTQTVGERRVERAGRRRSASGKLRGRIR